MLLNLWDENLSSAFMELYNIPPVQMCNILVRLSNGDDDDYIKIFCEETGIKLDEINVVDNDLEFLGKIVSTTIDDCDYLEKNGLIPIDVLLEQSSPIHQHLKNHNIEIYPSTHELLYMGKRYPIPIFHQKCEWCIRNETECAYTKHRFIADYCPYREAIQRLSIKLYSDNSEIEMFLSAPRNEMLSYSTVKEYPEMLHTIDNFIYKYFRKSENICYSWKSQKQYSYIVTFRAKYEDLSYCTNYINASSEASQKEALDKLSDYEKYCKNNYYSITAVPKCFWDNIWLINTCLTIIGSFGDCRSTIYAGLKHHITIPYSQLTIDKIQDT